MLRVARIAQSVEQGIENPRVLGSIPSPGTIFRRTRLWRVFRFLGYGLSIELRSIIRPKASPCGPALKRCSTRRQRRLSESGRPIQKNPPMAGFSLSGVRTLHRTAFDYSAKGAYTAGQRHRRMLPSLLASPKNVGAKGKRIAAFSALGVKVATLDEQCPISLRRILTLW